MKVIILGIIIIFSVAMLLLFSTNGQRLIKENKKACHKRVVDYIELHMDQFRK